MANNATVLTQDCDTLVLHDSAFGNTQAVEAHNLDPQAHPYIQERIDGKQDTISDLSTIRSGAASGATALSANMGKELNDRIDNISARGRFLALWNCATGLAETQPTASPYDYKSGDYFIVGTVAAAGGTNYKPSGSSYTTGVASSTVEAASVDSGDCYYYDGTTWTLQINTQKEITFQNVAGDPYDNTNLAAALNGKQDTISDLSAIRSGAAAGATAVQPADLQSALATKQDTLVSGTNIKTVNNNSLVGSGNIDIESLPSQTGQSGKFLTTDGTSARWEQISIPANTYTEDNLAPGDNIEFVKQNYRLNCNVQGSPTITDGVASGFSDSDYLWHSNWLTAATTSFDVVTAVKLNAATASNLGIIDAGDTWGMRLTASVNNTVRLRIITAPQTTASVDITGTTPLTAGTKVYIKASYNSTEGYKLYTSSDGQTWNLEGSSSFTSTPNATTNYLIGRNGASGLYLNGSIYLQDTYVNIDGNTVWTAYVAVPVTVINSSGLKNTAGGENSLTLLGTATTVVNAVNIGYQAETSARRGIALGYRALASGQDAVAIGPGSESSTTTRTTASGEGSVAIGQFTQSGGERGTALGMGASASAYGATSVGQFAYASAQYAIQIGQGFNSTANTLSVGLSSSNNYLLLQANGKIPAARLPSMAPTLTWYTGNTGTTVTIANTSSAALVKVYKNGMLLQPTEDYSISGTTLTLVTALVSTDKITTEVF